MKCPNGHEVNGQVKFCPTCGADLRSIKFCTNCGYERNGDEEVCPRCGKPFNIQDTFNLDIDKTESNKTLLIVLSLVALAIIGVGCWLYFNKGDEIKVVSAVNNKTESVQVAGSLSSDTIEEVIDSVIDPIEPYYAGSSSSDEEYESSESSFQNNDIEYAEILHECETEIRSIQSEIESVCNQFVVMASGDMDPLTYGRLKITMSNGVDDLVRKANQTFDRAIKRLNDIGEINAANNMKEEKIKFYRAITTLKYQAQQRADMSY